MGIFFAKNNFFWAIIIGAVIISFGIYFGSSRLSEGNRGSSTALSSEQNQTTSDYSVIPRNNGIVESTDSCGAEGNTIVTKVIDGDTVVVGGGYHVRLIGMDADETGYPCYQPAKTRLEDLVLGKQVKLEKDITDLDQYGRCLRYIFVGDTNIDVQLVKEGLAVARFYQPDVKYKSEITQAEQYAQQKNIGCKWVE